MKAKQDGNSYSFPSFREKHSSLSLSRKSANGVEYIPLVLTNEEITVDGKTYSYDSESYPKFGAKYKGQVYHAVNKETGEFVLHSTTFVPAAKATYTLYANNPNLDIGKSVKAWSDNIRQTGLADGGAPLPLSVVGTPGVNWTPVEGISEKPLSAEGDEIVKLTANVPIGFSFEDVEVVPTEDEKLFSQVWVHLNAMTRVPFILIATVWAAGGEHDFAIKIDPVNGNVYYGGNIVRKQYAYEWELLPINFYFPKDEYGWYDINIPISVVLEALDNSNHMYALTFAPVDDVEDNTFYLDNLYLYKAYRSVEELRVLLGLEIDSAQKLIQCADIGENPGQYPQSAVDRLSGSVDEAVAVYEDMTKTREEVGGMVLYLSREITVFKESVISDLMPDTSHPKEYIVDMTSSTANWAYSKYYTAVKATASSGSASAMDAIDGNGDSRWESEHSDPQWFMVDLGTEREFDQIAIAWETAAGKDYTFDYSLDGEEWIPFSAGVTGNTKLDIIYTTSRKRARYIRLNGTARATIYGYSIYEFGVFDTKSHEYELMETERILNIK